MKADEARQFVDALEVRAAEGHTRTDVNNGSITVESLIFAGREHFTYDVNGQEFSRGTLVQALTMVEQPECPEPAKTSGIWPMR